MASIPSSSYLLDSLHTRTLEQGQRELRKKVNGAVKYTRHDLLVPPVLDEDIKQLEKALERDDSAYLMWRLSGRTTSDMIWKRADQASLEVSGHSFVDDDTTTHDAIVCENRQEYKLGRLLVHEKYVAPVVQASGKGSFEGVNITLLVPGTCDLASSRVVVLDDKAAARFTTPYGKEGWHLQVSTAHLEDLNHVGAHTMSLDTYVQVQQDLCRCA
jgi:hypothetical protein